MQPMEKNVEKQLVVRTFEPDMNALKQTAKQLAHMQDTSLNLYGQAGEVLIVVTARAYAQAAATELTENVAEQFELALGPAAYGRGKGSLAYFTAGELIQSESTIAAADPATGALLAEEFSHTKRGPSVFDFGDGSYNDSRVVAKIKNAVYKYAEEGNAPQIAAARAAAAARFAHADFGVASVGMGTGAEVVYLAVAHRGYVYIKRIKNGEGAGKVVALSALDMVRRLAQKQPVDRARMFKANSDFDWNAPLKKRRSSKYAAPIAVLAVLLGADVEAVTGRGGGITEESFRKKKAVIRTAIEVNRPDRDDVVGVLSKVGGFDLAAMCGAFLGAAAARRPAVIDGLISAAAALCAVRLCPNVHGYLVPSHASFEIGYRLAMEAMDLRPLFDLGMRLGEGSGCPLAFQVLDAACAVINDMATFDEAGINDDYLDEIRRGDQFTP